MIGVGRRGCPTSISPGAAAAGEQTGHGGDAAAQHEARDGRADHDLALVRPQLRAPVRGLDHLAAEVLHGDRELGAVGFDRAPDLLRRALGAHRDSTLPGVVGATTPSGVAGWGFCSVALISWASSMAICGVGGVPFLKKRAAMKPAMPPKMNRIPARIR